MVLDQPSYCRVGDPLGSPPDDARGSTPRSGTSPRLGHRRIAAPRGPAGHVDRGGAAAGVPAGDARSRPRRRPGLVADCAAWSEGGRPGVARLLDAGVEFTAVVAGNDLLRARLLRRVPGARHRCPGGPQGGRVQRHAPAGQAAAAADQCRGCRTTSRRRGGADAARRRSTNPSARAVGPAAGDLGGPGVDRSRRPPDPAAQPTVIRPSTAASAMSVRQCAPASRTPATRS